MVGAGYDIHTGEIRIVDPARNVPTKYYSFSSVMSGGQIGSGKGHCFAIIAY